MDRLAANTLRTLGIIAVAICIILASGLLLLLALCANAFANWGGHQQVAPADLALIWGLIIAAVLVLIGGILLIAHLARGYLRDPNRPAERPSRRFIPSSAELRAQFRELLPPRPEPSSVDILTHVSPASSVAIQRLATAISAKIIAEVALGLVGWYGAFGETHAPFPVLRFGFIAWGAAAIAPHLVLLYALARRPGRTAFAYALIIPSLHILFGIFGHSALFAFILRAGQLAAPLVSIVPWLLDVLILYLAWKAIRLTGLLPDPARLIAAAAVIFLYTSLLPVLVILLNYLHR